MGRHEACPHNRYAADCRATSPTATGQVCEVDATRYRVVDVATSEAGAVRWIATASREVGAYDGTCTPGLDGAGDRCLWRPSPSLTRTLALLLGSLQDGAVRFAPAPGVSWPVNPGAGPRFARGTTAIDSQGRIHIAYFLEQSADVEVRHLTLSP